MKYGEVIKGLAHAKDILKANIAITASMGMPSVLSDKDRQAVGAIDRVVELLEDQMDILREVSE